MPSPGSTQLRQCPRPGVLNDGENVFPQNAYLPNVETFKTVPPASQLAIFFMIEKVVCNVNMSDELPSYLNRRNCKGGLFALIYRNF